MKRMISLALTFWTITLPVLTLIIIMKFPLVHLQASPPLKRFVLLIRITMKL
uniref:Uncharacterized protein n=1 Tax=Meloidogyne enterolobii TaxID=390850 RepID=A0A6V7W0M9_MELEN|nr:unnamed protein product [Meloidogyne enterolobii]